MGVKNPNRTRVHRASRPPGFPRGVWHPALIGIIHGYPKTQEDFNVRQEAGRKVWADYKAKHGHYPNRKGVPDGWGDRGREVLILRQRAAVEAKGIVKTMKDKGFVASDIDPRAEEALEFAVSVIRAKDDDGKLAHAVKDHLAAVNIVLQYTKAKPASTSNVNVSAAENFLEALAAGEDPPEDAA